MSIKSARAFYERVVTDEPFRSQLQNAPGDDERRAIVQAAGYNFTHEEWQATTKQMQESDAIDMELSDVELEEVAGGVIYGSPINPFPFPF